MFNRRFLGTMAFGAIAAAAGCDGDLGTAATEAEILGGTVATTGQYPTVVAIVVAGGQRGLCTGTLVAPDLVLTAAHCVSPATLGYDSQEELTAETQVIVGRLDLRRSGGRIIDAEKTIPLPTFAGPSDADIGLIRLPGRITDITPSPINLDPAAAPIGVEVAMVGYGLTSSEDQSSAGTEMVLARKPSISCASQQGSGASDATFLCFSQTDGTGKCSGDSGGPSFADIGGRPTVVGVTSYGDQFCEYFGADMRVDAAQAFLQEHAPELICIDDGTCNEDCEGGVTADPDCGGGGGGDDDGGCAAGGGGNGALAALLLALAMLGARAARRRVTAPIRR
jgi:trypsin